MALSKMAPSSCSKSHNLSNKNHKLVTYPCNKCVSCEIDYQPRTPARRPSGLCCRRDHLRCHEKECPPKVRYSYSTKVKNQKEMKAICKFCSELYHCSRCPSHLEASSDLGLSLGSAKRLMCQENRHSEHFLHSFKCLKPSEKHNRSSDNPQKQKQEAEAQQAKQDDQLANYFVDIHLINKSVKKGIPSVKRTLLVPTTATVEQLHDYIQVSFGWSGSKEDACNYEFLNSSGDVLFNPSVCVRSLRVPAFSPRDPSQVTNLAKFCDAANTCLQDFINHYGISTDNPMIYAYTVKNRAAGEANIKWFHRCYVKSMEEPYRQKAMCLSAEGQGIAEGINNDEWVKLVAVYRRGRRWRNSSLGETEKRLINWYETHCPNRGSVSLWRGWDHDSFLRRTNKRLAKLSSPRTS